MTDPTPGELGTLPCGRDPLEVVDRAHAGRSAPHERTCPYCQGEIAAADPAARAALALADMESDTPVPDTLLPSVMRTVWSDMRRATLIPLPIDAGASTAFIADHAVAALIENALDGITDLQVHTCTVTVRPPSVQPTDSPHEPDPSARLGVAVSAAAAYISDVRRISDQARALVRRTIQQQLGWTVDEIDIDIVDVYLPEVTT